MEKYTKLQLLTFQNVFVVILTPYPCEKKTRRKFFVVLKIKINFFF